MTLPLDILRCPACAGPLTADDPLSHDVSLALECSHCPDTYPILRGTPRLLVRPLREQLLPELGRHATPGSASDGATKAKVRTAASFGYEWQRFHQLRDQWERNFLDYMQPRGAEFFEGKRVLDGGCGMGRHAYYAAKFGADVVAVDLSDAIDVAHRNTREIGRVCTIQADLYNLPFEPESFDFVYSIGVLHHLPDPEGAFRNLLRYLKPGGELQIYLYWWPEGQPVKSAMLSAVRLLRQVTTRIPHGLLYWLAYPLAALAFGAFVLPRRLLRRLPGGARLAERLPMGQYVDYPFQVCVGDQFDRFSAPIENRYTRAEVEAWLRRAGLEEIRVLPNWGWLGSGRKPGPEEAARPPSESPQEEAEPPIPEPPPRRRSDARRRPSVPRARIPADQENL